MRTEAQIVEDFNRASAAWEKGLKEVEDHFMPLVRACKTMEECEGVLRRCPSESVTYVFILDHMRQTWPPGRRRGNTPVRSDGA